MGDPMRTGVYLCQTGTADQGAVNAHSVEQYAANLPQVELVRNLGTLPPLDLQALAAEIHGNQLERLVIAGDSPGFFKPALPLRWPWPAAIPRRFAWRRFVSTAPPAASPTCAPRRCWLAPCWACRSRWPPCPHHAVHPGHAGGRRRRGRHPGGPGDRRRRQAGLSRRADRHHRRPHGDVRQDLPDPRLRGLHPHAQDGGRGPAREYRPDDVLRGGRGERQPRRPTR